MSTWREQLDARIDRCPGCDDWRWDGICERCGVLARPETKANTS